MSIIAIKSCARKAVSFLNQPVIKENIKNIAGVVSFAFGIVEIVDLYKDIKVRKLLVKSCNSDGWKQTAKKIVMLCAKISIILSGIVSRPGCFLISNLVGRIFTSDQLHRVFGPNTTFAVNPWHPRHVISVAAVVLAMPMMINTLGRACTWICKKVCGYKQDTKHEADIVDKKVSRMASFNVLTSRPLLHWGNRLGRIVS